MSENRRDKPDIPEQLFHTVLTVVDYHRDTSGSTRHVHVLGTHTNLQAAKSFALDALELLGYQPSDFADFASRRDTPPEEWQYGDGVLVFAKAPRGQEFLIGIDTTSNTESLPAGPNDTLKLPDRRDSLHYVLQSRMEFRPDKSGIFQRDEVQGCYVREDDALAAAKVTLPEDPHEYAQYDDRDDAESDGEWPFGEDVVVHAVAQWGENYTVAVKTAPEAQRYHAKVH